MYRSESAGLQALVHSLPSVYLCSMYTCYQLQCLVTAQIAFSIHMRNGLVQWRNQDTVNARACGHTTFVRTFMQNTEESKGGFGHAPLVIVRASPGRFLGYFGSYLHLKSGAISTMPFDVDVCVV